MGLSQIKLSPYSGHFQSWILPAVLAALCLLGLVFGEPIRDQLRWERSAVAAGEFYRLLSGHFVHLGVGHTLLNAFGLGLVWLLVGGAFSMLGWIVALGIVIAVIDLGFWFWMPSLGWYVGLSGVLHGLLVAGLIGSLRVRRRESLILGAVIAAKLGYETFVGPLPGSAEAAGGAVIVEAHLYGAVGGLLGGVLLSIRGGRRVTD